MKLLLSFVLVCVFVACYAQESEDDEKPKESSWWGNFKSRVKTVLTKWRDDIKSLWDDVLTKASDMRSWTADMFESFKVKMKEWLESQPNLPDDEKNEIETFISKLKVPTEKSTKPDIDP